MALGERGARCPSPPLPLVCAVRPVQSLLAPARAVGQEHGTCRPSLALALLLLQHIAARAVHGRNAARVAIPALHSPRRPRTTHPPQRMPHVRAAQGKSAAHELLSRAPQQLAQDRPLAARLALWRRAAAAGDVRLDAARAKARTGEKNVFGQWLSVADLMELVGGGR